MCDVLHTKNKGAIGSFKWYNRMFVFISLRFSYADEVCRLSLQ